MSKDNLVLPRTTPPPNVSVRPKCNPLLIVLYGVKHSPFYLLYVIYENTLLVIISCNTESCNAIDVIHYKKRQFFDKSRLSLQKWLLLMFFWARQDPVSHAKIDTEVSIDAAIDVYGWLRHICCRKHVYTNIQLEGSNKIVQIDESLFRHKSKHHRGRATSREVWVFGMVDTSTQPALGYMEIVPDRRAQTLLPIIQSHVNPGTTVKADQWKAYSSVSSLRNAASHSTVNHSLHFVEPTTGVNTQHV